MEKHQKLHSALRELSAKSIANLHLAIKDEYPEDNRQAIRLNDLANHEFINEDYHDEIIMFLHEFMEKHPAVSHHFFIQLKDICDEVIREHGEIEEVLNHANTLKDRVEQIHAKLKENFLNSKFADKSYSLDEKEQQQINEKRDYYLKNNAAMTKIKADCLRKNFDMNSLTDHDTAVTSTTERLLLNFQNYNKLIENLANKESPEEAFELWKKMPSVLKFQTRVLKAFIPKLNDRNDLQIQLCEYEDKEISEEKTAEKKLLNLKSGIIKALLNNSPDTILEQITDEKSFESYRNIIKNTHFLIPKIVDTYCTIKDKPPHLEVILAEKILNITNTENDLEQIIEDLIEKYDVLFETTEIAPAKVRELFNVLSEKFSKDLVNSKIREIREREEIAVA